MMTVLLRLLALVFIVELSGAAHAVLEMAASAGLVAHLDDGCDDGEGHECPPGCLGCHCTHGAVASCSPRIELRIDVPPLPTRIATHVRAPTSPPPTAPRAPLYRPPKARVVSQATS